MLSLCARNPKIACMRTNGNAGHFEIRHVNEAWEQLTGYSCANIVGEKFGLSFLKGRETQSCVLKQMHSNVEARIAFFGDVINYKKDGTKFVNRLSIVPLPNGGFIETCMDTCGDQAPQHIRNKNMNRKRVSHSQADLPRHKRDRNEACTSQSSATMTKAILSICAKNRDIPFIRTKDKSHHYEVSFVNEAWEKLTGYSSTSIIGRKYGSSMLKGRETRESVTDEIRRCVQAKEPFFGDVINYKKDGTKFMNRLSIVPLANGEFIGTLKDATSAMHSIPTCNGVLPGIIDCISDNGRKKARGCPRSLGSEATARQVQASSEGDGDGDAAQSLRGGALSRTEEASRAAEPLALVRQKFQALIEVLALQDSRNAMRVGGGSKGPKWNKHDILAEAIHEIKNLRTRLTGAEGRLQILSQSVSH